jgi:hypothetical protein
VLALPPTLPRRRCSWPLLLPLPVVVPDRLSPLSGDPISFLQFGPLTNPVQFLVPGQFLLPPIVYHRLPPLSRVILCSRSLPSAARRCISRSMACLSSLNCYFPFLPRSCLICSRRRWASRSA